MSMPSRIPPKAPALSKPRELQMYKEWRFLDLNATAVDDASVLLPTAIEYADVLVQHRQQKDGDEVCEEGEVQKKLLWCPKCILKIHLKLLDELWDNWLDVGGPWRILPLGVAGQDFILAKRTYYQRKFDTINAMDGVEDIAHSEAAWEAVHAAEDVAAAKEHGAVKAHPHHRTPPSTVRKKRLSYSPGTLDDTRHRPNAFYTQHMISYDPDSPQACPDDDRNEDEDEDEDKEGEDKWADPMNIDDADDDTVVNSAEKEGHNS
ncbi:hypothetical protein EJ02DRAFT_429801 [Clathrospora elynae]|uniref:Uncharacterized protein n=1 Tax=Clathrospora elynae TaxID=706981 RepID=A0A6A5T7F9_9PLEO|nr:hypothetical protein EJ02DRAFT_429801 [Clathrospora elynae]